jgi:hypothetical protein
MAWNIEITEGGGIADEKGWYCQLRPLCPKDRREDGSFCLTVIDPLAVGIIAAVRDAVIAASKPIRDFRWNGRSTDGWRWINPGSCGPVNSSHRYPAYARSKTPAAVLPRDKEGHWLCPHCNRRFRRLGSMPWHLRMHGDVAMANVLGDYIRGEGTAPVPAA